MKSYFPYETPEQAAGQGAVHGQFAKGDWKHHDECDKLLKESLELQAESQRLLDEANEAGLNTLKGQELKRRSDILWTRAESKRTKAHRLPLTDDTFTPRQ